MYHICVACTAEEGPLGNAMYQRTVYHVIHTSRNHLLYPVLST